MDKRYWGKNGQLQFESDYEYYKSLGALCRPGAFHISFETNSKTDSWGDAFRIRCTGNPDRMTDAFKHAAKSNSRINNNDYIENLVDQHDFTFNTASKIVSGKYDDVKHTVPTQYHDAFDEGYHSF